MGWQIKFRIERYSFFFSSNFNLSFFFPRNSYAEYMLANRREDSSKKSCLSNRAADALAKMGCTCKQTEAFVYYSSSSPPLDSTSILYLDSSKIMINMNLVLIKNNNKMT